MRTDFFVESVFVSTSSVTAVTPSPVSGKVRVWSPPIRHPKRKNYTHKLKFILQKTKALDSISAKQVGSQNANRLAFYLKSYSKNFSIVSRSDSTKPEIIVPLPPPRPPRDWRMLAARDESSSAEETIT